MTVQSVLGSVLCTPGANWKTGAKLAEKTVNVSRADPKKFVLFQPLENAPLAILEGEGQANVAEPPAGYIKLKMANYAPEVLPFEKTDVIVVGVNSNFEFIYLDTLTSISQNLGNEDFHLIPTTNDILGYSFIFRAHGTEAKIKNAMGEDYINMDIVLIPMFMTPIPEKNIYTIYFTAVEPPVVVDYHIKAGDKYYNINPEILYVN